MVRVGTAFNYKMSDRYSNLTDEELIGLSRSGDSAATDFLMEKYKGLVRSKAADLFLPNGGDKEDLLQEGMLGLFKALRDYDGTKEASFSTFANLCVTRQLYTAVEAAGRKKHQPLNEAVSYDAELPAGQPGAADGAQSGMQRKGSAGTIGETGGTFLDLLASEETDPEQQYISWESSRQLEESIRAALSPMERQVLDLYLADLDYREIAQRLNKDPKATDNALQRIKSKVRKILQKG